MSSDARQRFKDKKDLANQWAEMSATVVFEEASDAAFVTYMESRGSPTEMGASAAMAWKMIGAREYRDILKTLATSEPIPKPRPIGNLDHTIKQ